MEKKRKTTKKSYASLLSMFFGVILVLIALIILYQLKHAPKADRMVTTTAAATVTSNSSTALQNTGGTDARKYYSENAQKVLQVTPAAESEHVYSEKSVSEELSSRGFGEDFPITYEYGINGSAQQPAQVDAASSATHPQYNLTYITGSGEYWTVTVSNGCVTAYPVTYNLEHNNSGTELILTEGESITAYDSETNCFYEVIPKQSVLTVKHISAITAETLERLTAQEIEKL